MKTSELTGPALDFWVAKAEGLEIESSPSDAPASPFRIKVGAVWCRFHPSQVSNEGDPIIDRLRIEVLQIAGDGSFAGAPTPHIWMARCNGKSMQGPTRLNAAMRLRVFMEFGEEVPDDLALS
jgi:hypothetical protein